MPIASRSRFPDLAHALVAVLVAGALAACDRPAGDARDTSPVAAASGRLAADTPRVAVAAPATVSDSAFESRLNLSEMMIVLEAVAGGEVPADLLVTAPDGRRTGVEPESFAVRREILHASYDSSPPPTQTDSDPEPRALPKQFTIATPELGDWTVDVVGRRADAYVLLVRIVTPRGAVREGALRGQRIGAGEVQRFVIPYDSTDTAPPRIVPSPARR